MSAVQALKETEVVTQDMRLPDGSTVIQCILVEGEDGSVQLDFRCITIGASEYNPANPAHRFLQAVAERLPELMEEIAGGNRVEHVPQAAGSIDERLLLANGATQQLEVQEAANEATEQDAAPSSSEPNAGA